MPQLPEDEAESEILQKGDMEAYAPDPQAVWAAECSRAMLVVLARRFGGDFAREVHDEIFARAAAYSDGGRDDLRDGAELTRLLTAPFWGDLFKAGSAIRD